MDRGSGVEFDEIIAEKNSKGSESYSYGIKMYINKELDLSRNVTPAYELFHLYQYSNSMFKVGWYLEGMARWVEQAFVRPSANSVDSRPVSSCSEVYLENYSASRYWQGLAITKKLMIFFFLKNIWSYTIQMDSLFLKQTRLKMAQYSRIFLKR
ncbi:MAG TPA: hypothetical protein VFD11_08715 [Thiopseudomonas sp.]|nr:hypothetical protein [Thiopseudomonas sp.]